MAKRVRSINYDLDDLLLQEYYPNPKSYKNAWRDVKGFLCSNGFEKRQYSGVISTRPFEDREITELFDDLLDTFKWLEPCILKFDVTDVADQYSLIDEWRKTNFLKDANNIDLSNPDKNINEGKNITNDFTDYKVVKSNNKNKTK